MTAPEQPTPPLLPCPFCGSRAVFGEITDPADEANFGGNFITCTGCVATTDLRFACGDDPGPLLAEAWNRRTDFAQRAAEAVERERERISAELDIPFLVVSGQAREAAPTEADKAWAADIISKRATPPPGDAGQRYRHRKRGTTYQVIGDAEAQSTNDDIQEGDPVVVYRSEHDGSLWVRPTEEFHDGRFERLTPSGPPGDAGERWRDLARECLYGPLYAVVSEAIYNAVFERVAAALQSERTAAASRVREAMSRAQQAGIDNLRECGVAFRMIRDTLAELSGAVPPIRERDVGPPNYTTDAEEIIDGFRRALTAAASQARRALDESVKLQSHYAALLNDYDGGKRLTFASADEWIARLNATEEPTDD